MANSGSLVVTINMTLYFIEKNYTFTILSSAELMGPMEAFEMEKFSVLSLGRGNTFFGDPIQILIRGVETRHNIFGIIKLSNMS